MRKNKGKTKVFRMVKRGKEAIKGSKERGNTEKKEMGG